MCAAPCFLIPSLVCDTEGDEGQGRGERNGWAPGIRACPAPALFWDAPYAMAAYSSMSAPTQRRMSYWAPTPLYREALARRWASSSSQ